MDGAHHDIGRDHDQGLFPRKPEAPERNPEQLVHGTQFGAAVFTPEHGYRSAIAQVIAECLSEEISQAVDFTTAQHFV